MLSENSCFYSVGKRRGEKRRERSITQKTDFETTKVPLHSPHAKSSWTRSTFHRSGVHQWQRFWFSAILLIKQSWGMQTGSLSLSVHPARYCFGWACAVVSKVPGPTRGCCRGCCYLWRSNSSSSSKSGTLSMKARHHRKCFRILDKAWVRWVSRRSSQKAGRPFSITGVTHRSRATGSCLGQSRISRANTLQAEHWQVLHVSHHQTSLLAFN